MPVRRGVPADAGAIADVHVRSWKAAFPGLIPDTYLEALRPEDRLQQWQEALAGDPWPVVLVIEEAGRLLGFCALGPTRDEDRDPGSVGEVFTIYLDPETWGRGEGRALLAAALDVLEGAGFATASLWTLGTNTRARRFYEHLGWTADGASKEHDWGAFVATDVRYVTPLGCTRPRP